MPTRNVVKTYIPDTYYHIYNRGWNRSEIFRENEDYDYFEWLLARHLSVEPVKDQKGREYRHLREDIDLVAYCLMPNHFHILAYQRYEHAISHLASSVLTAYTMYFNKKYKRRGPLFESTYKAVSIATDSQLMHITRYIHLNHDQYRNWAHSSYRDYMVSPREWVDPTFILELFDSKCQYKEFMDDYESMQRELGIIKASLADT